LLELSCDIIWLHLSVVRGQIVLGVASFFLTLYSNSTILCEF